MLPKCSGLICPASHDVFCLGPTRSTRDAWSSASDPSGRHRHRPAVADSEGQPGGPAGSAGAGPRYRRRGSPESHRRGCGFLRLSDPAFATREPLHPPLPGRPTCPAMPVMSLPVPCANHCWHHRLFHAERSSSELPKHKDSVYKQPFCGRLASDIWKAWVLYKAQSNAGFMRLQIGAPQIPRGAPDWNRKIRLCRKL